MHAFRSSRATHRDAGTGLHVAETLVHLGYLGARLHGGRVLEIGAEDETFGYLLDWLRPRRLLTEDISTILSQTPLDVISGLPYSDATFDAVFVSLPNEAKPSRVRVSELRRALVPGGLAVVIGTSLDRDQRANWPRLRVHFEGLAFEIVDETRGMMSSLVANAPGARGKGQQKASQLT